MKLYVQWMEYSYCARPIYWSSFSQTLKVKKGKQLSSGPIHKNQIKRLVLIIKIMISA